MIQLTLLHTNDIHGHVPQLLRIAGLVDHMRAEVKQAGGFCIFVDAGDAEDSSLLESNLTKGTTIEAILRGAGCEQVALGNAIPLRYGPQAISDLMKHFGRPLLCANMMNQNGDLIEGLQPFSVEQFGSTKIGFIGLTAPMEGYETVFKLKVPKPFDILPPLISQVRAEGARTIILLSHLGSVADQQLADAIQGIDVIVGAHDHKILYPPRVINGTLVIQAGEYGQHLGRLDLTLDPETGKVVHHSGKLIPVGDDLPFDAKTQAVWEMEQARVRGIMGQEIGILMTPLEFSEDRECAAGNLLADALLERMTGSQIALTLGGHWLTGLKAGSVTKGALYTASRSTANPARVELTGEQVSQFLREALKPENASRRLRPLRGAAVGMPHVAGMQVRYDPSSSDSMEIRVGNEPLRQKEKYIVAATDREFMDLINYLSVTLNQIEFEVPTIVPEVLEDYIARHSPLNSMPSNRIAK